MVDRIGEEVKDCAVVPGVVGARRLPLKDVADDVGNPLLRRPEPPAGCREGLMGNVERCDVVAAVGEERVRKPRRASADVDHRAGLPAKPLNGMGRGLLEPRDRVKVA